MSNIVDLAPETISTIFKYLKQTKDRQNLAETHPVFEKAFAIYAAESKCYRNIIFDSLPTEDWAFILSACGSAVVRIASYRAENAQAAFKLASEHCPNLEDLIIPVRSEYWDAVKPLLARMKKLKELRLMNAYNPIDLAVLLELPELSTLQLLAFNVNDVTIIQNILQLKNLFVRNVVIPVNIYELCAYMAQLESLELEHVNISFPSTPVRDPMWPKLKFLKMGITSITNEMHYLPKLKILHMHIQSDDDMQLDEIFGRSVRRYANTLLALRLYCTDRRPLYANNNKTIGQLKALKSLVCSNLNNSYLNLIKLDNLQKLIIMYSMNVTNSGIVVLLRGCKNLRSLDVSGCRRVNKNVVGPLIDVLKQHGVRPDNPLVLTVHLRTFGDVNEGRENLSQNPYSNLLVVKICDYFTSERPFVVPDPPFEIEYFVNE